MNLDLFERLLSAVFQRNPVAAEALLPGLPRELAESRLQSAQIVGQVGAILDIYAWRNGSRTDQDQTLSELSLFPGSIYVFMGLETALSHRTELLESVTMFPHVPTSTERLFPMFWDNGISYLAVDFGNPNNPVSIVDPESPDFLRPAYACFEAFLTDALRANHEDETLECFRLF